MRSITKFELQYAHRFYKFQGEAQYLHGHTGVLTIEVEDAIEPGVNMVYPCNEIQKVAWNVLKNFDHALVLREDDPLLPAILDVYEKHRIDPFVDGRNTEIPGMDLRAVFLLHGLPELRQELHGSIPCPDRICRDDLAVLRRAAGSKSFQCGRVVWL